jgi:hypothetical protein
MNHRNPQDPLETAIATAQKGLEDAVKFGREDAEFYASLHMAISAFVHTKLQLNTAVRVLEVITGPNDPSNKRFKPSDN